jgi:hypothetical protein
MKCPICDQEIDEDDEDQPCGWPHDPADKPPCGKDTPMPPSPQPPAEIRVC